MVMKTQVENLDDVAEPLREHYKETTDEKTKAKVYVLDTEGSIDVLPPVKTLRTELGSRRISEKTAKDALLAWQPVIAIGVKPEEVATQLARIPELEAASEGKIDEKKMGELVETRIKGRLAPVERERDVLKNTVVEKDKEIAGFKTADTNRKISGSVSKAARDAKVVDTALEDVEMLGERLFEVAEDGRVVTKDNVGTTPGMEAKDWLAEMQSKRPHWWGPTSGGGGGGGRPGAPSAGANPWSRDHWNFTEQSRIASTEPARAEKLAAAAGTRVGGGMPIAKK